MKNNNQAEQTLILIADYGTGDPAFTEVSLRLKMLVPKLSILPLSTPPFSTLNTGFWIYQIALTKDLQNTYIFSNTAPRLESKNAQKDNAGEKLMYAKLSNGFEIIAVNSLYNFSFVKPYIQEFFFVKTKNNCSQFRSRDYYPQTVEQMVSHDYSFLGKKGDIEAIPNYPNNAIAAIDGYGNLKTTLRLSELNYIPGQKIAIELNGIKKDALYTDGVFNIEESQLAFAPGSSGHEDRFMELFVRGDSAYELFGKPKVETPYSISA